MKKKQLQLKPLLIIILCLFSGTTRGQHPNFNQYETSFTPSAEGMGSIKSISSSVSHYAGTANINIPIYTITSGDIKVPVSLSYNTSGIRVEDIETCVGLGWRLSAGGKVTRMSKKPDESDKPHCLWFNWERFDNKGDQTTAYYREIYDYFHKRQNKSKNPSWDENYANYVELDSEPDIFYFEIPGKSGMFVFDHDGVPHTIPRQDIRIEWVDRLYFIITDIDGTKYTFGNNDSSETSYVTTSNPNWIKGGDQNVSKVRYVSTWWLDVIQTLYGETVNFTYETGTDYKYKSYNHAFNMQIRETTNGNCEMHYIDVGAVGCPVTNILYPKYISCINFSKGKVEFEYTDCNGHINMKMLDRIHVYPLMHPQNSHRESLKLMEIGFGYSTFENRSLKLDNIYNVNRDRLEKSTLYSFIYYTDHNLPEKNTKNFDHWGFYNGKGNTVFYPKIKPEDIGGLVVDKGADRSPSFEHTKANILTDIIYHNGSRTSYVYEPHKMNDTIICGGLRIAKIIHTDGKQSTQTSYEYDLPALTGEAPIYYFISGYKSEGKWHYHASGLSKPANSITDLSGVSIGYGQVTEIYPNGAKTVYKFTTAETPNCADRLGGTWALWREKISDAWQFSYHPDGYEFHRTLNTRAVTSLFWRRGLLKELTQWDSDGIYISSIRNDYNIEDTGYTGEEIECYVCCGDYSDLEIDHEWWQITYDYFIPEDAYKGFNVYKIYSEPVKLSHTCTERGPYNLYGGTNFSYRSKSNILESVAYYDHENSVRTGANQQKYVYNYLYNNNSIPAGSYGSLLSSFMDNNAISTPIEQIIYEGEANILGGGKVINANLNIFKKADDSDHIVLSEIKEYFRDPYDNIPFSQSRLDSDFNLVYDNRYETAMYIDEYDEKYRPISAHKPGGVSESVIYGYYNTIPVANVVNATSSIVWGRNEVIHTSFEADPYDSYEYNQCIAYLGEFLKFDKAKSGEYVFKGSLGINLSNLKPQQEYIFSYWTYNPNEETPGWKYRENRVTVTGIGSTYVITATGGQYIDELRIMPIEAHMVTYTYKPGIGRLSETDANGRTVHYEYDHNNMLSKVYDDDFVLIRKVTYDTNSN